MNFYMKTPVIFLFVGLFWLSHLQSAHADHNQHLFDEANQLYQQESFQQAIEKYLEIINAGYESWQLYYNLGNAYYKTRQFGRAILNYERAQKLNPKNEDIQFNLQIANMTVVDKIVAPPQFFVSKWLSRLKNLWGIQTLTFLMIGGYLLMAVLIIIKIFTRRSRPHRLLNVLLTPIIILLVIFTIIFVVRIHEHNSIHYAIVLVDKVDVLSSPDVQGTELFSLHQGVKFRVAELRGKWAKIRLTDGKVGWVKQNIFEII